MKKPTVHAGEVYGRLTVIRQAGLVRNRDRAYLCRCECGAEVRVAGYCLKNGNTRSCGCLRRDRAAERMTGHGHSVARSKTPTYETWRGMIGRCRSTAPGREWYFDRGIGVVERWRGPSGFATFLADMGERPAGLTLDRIDPDGSYEPGNCRWATTGEQAHNRRQRARLSEVEALRRVIEEQREEIARLRAA
jgi:hypothetical protein